MSEFAFFQFMGLDLLTQEEIENKTEMITFAEEVLDALDTECDTKGTNYLIVRYGRVPHKVKPMVFRSCTTFGLDPGASHH